MKKLFFALLLMINFGASNVFGQLVVESNASQNSSNYYKVHINLTPVEIVKNNIAQWGCNYKVRVLYNIYFTNASGAVISGNGLLNTLQIYFKNCVTNEQMYIGLPLNGGTGNLLSTTATVADNSSCASLDLSDICTTYRLLINGQKGISSQWVENVPWHVGGNPLPIELGAFNGEQQGQQIDLSWITYSERENEVFFVERCANAIDYEVIGTVLGGGTTSIEQSYAFTDQSPVNGVNYYRLRQRDANGNEEAFEPIAVTYNGPSKFSSNVFPNPTTEDNVQIRLSNVDAKHVYIETYSLLGQLLQSTLVVIHSNEQQETITLEGNEHAYLVVVRSETEVLDRHRILVQR